MIEITREEFVKRYVELVEMLSLRELSKIEKYTFTKDGEHIFKDIPSFAVLLDREGWEKIKKLIKNKPKFDYGIKETESAHFHKLYHHIIDIDKLFEELKKVVEG